MPPPQTTRRTGTPYSVDALDDGARAEGGGLDEGAVDFGAGGVEGLAEEEAGEHGIDEDGAVAVVPVEGEQAARAGAGGGGLGGECGVQGGVALADDLDPPFEDVADGGLAGLDAVEAGQDRALDDAADAGDVGDGLFGRRRRRSRRWRCR